RPFTSSTASAGVNSCSRSYRFSASVYFLPFAISAPSAGLGPGRGPPLPADVDVVVLLDLDAHGAGGAGDLELGGLEVVGVEVGHLDLGDLGDLGVGDRADHLATRVVGRLLDAGRLPDQDRGGRGLE